MKAAVRQAGLHLAPRLTAAVLSARSRAYSHWLIRRWGIADLNRKLVQHLGRQVASGPFAGAQLPLAAEQEHIGPFLLGVYEHELHSWLEALRANRYSQVLDVGAKFGYYAVGLARLMPETPVVAFDTDWWARAATRQMAKDNGVASRVQVVGFCSPDWLRAHLKPNAFVLSDCEGYEAALFLGNRCAALRSATLLIETHDLAVPGVSAALVEQFQSTHVISRVDSADRRVPASLPFLSPEEAVKVVSEIRGPQTWLLLEPKSRASEI